MNGARRTASRRRGRGSRPARWPSAKPRRPWSVLGRRWIEIRELGGGGRDARAARRGRAAAESDVTNELAGGGVAFGEFVKSVGLAVAAAQSAAGQVARRHGEGALRDGDQHRRGLRAADQGRRRHDGQGRGPHPEAAADELPDADGVPVEPRLPRGGHERAGVQLPQRVQHPAEVVLGGRARLGQRRDAAASASRAPPACRTASRAPGVDASYGQDVAAGKLHMEATLEPRGDVELPRPFVLQKGPRMQLLVGAREPIHEDATPPSGDRPEGQADRGAPEDRRLARWTRTSRCRSTSASRRSTTRHRARRTRTARWTSTVTRTGAAYDPANPVRAMVRVSFGLVSQSVGIATVAMGRSPSTTASRTASAGASRPPASRSTARASSGRRARPPR